MNHRKICQGKDDRKLSKDVDLRREQAVPGELLHFKASDLK